MINFEDLDKEQFAIKCLFYGEFDGKQFRKESSIDVFIPKGGWGKDTIIAYSYRLDYPHEIEFNLWSGGYVIYYFLKKIYKTSN
jgi:hypothetical protein